MKAWREASSLIVVARKTQQHKQQTNSPFNYNVLFQKRKHNSTFPNMIVFPGGVVEETDFSDDWIDYFMSCGINKKHLDSLLKHKNMTQIFENNSIHRHVGLRIAAIRETFEEVGILICNPNSSPVSHWASAFEIDARRWQKKVHTNSEEFLNLCKEYKCYPNIWALHYRNNWLTPYIPIKRFDTVFYIAAFKETPRVTSDESEVAKVKWMTIDELLALNDREEISMMAPQKYELTRLARHSNLEQLLNAVSLEGFARNQPVYYPVFMKTKDGRVSILPGDDLYPSEIDFLKDFNERVDKTRKELREGCSRMHRLENLSNKVENWELITCNVQL